MEEQHSAAGARHAGTAFIPAPGSSAHAQGGLEALTLWWGGERAVTSSPWAVLGIFVIQKATLREFMLAWRPCHSNFSSTVTRSKDARGLEMGKEAMCFNSYFLGFFFPLFLVSNTTKLILSIGKILFFPHWSCFFYNLKKNFLSTYIVLHLLGVNLVSWQVLFSLWFSEIHVFS